MSFLGETKRRKVFQVAAVYLVVAWLLIQIVATVETPLNLPDWFDTAIIVFLAVGFPIAVILSWAFELTATGVVRDHGLPGSPVRGGRKLEYILALLLMLSLGWIGYREFSSAPERRDDVLPNSIAVLPFENLSPNPDDAYFAAGIHEQILNELAKIGGLSVIARTSVLQYEGVRRPISEIASELNVETVMEGSVRYAGDQVRVTAQLIDGTSGIRLWTDDYDGDLGDIFGIQSDIAERIADALEVQLSLTERENIERQLTSSSEAYSLYLRANGLISGNPAAVSARNRETALSFLDEAIDLDQAFAAAFAAKARLYASIAPNTASGNELLPATQDAIYALALENAQRAVELDDALGDAHFSLGFVYSRSNRPLEAIRYFQRAIELSPNNAIIRRAASVLQSMMGQHDEAIANSNRTINLSPNDTSMLYGLGRRLLYAGRYDDAATQFREATATGGADLEDAFLNLALAEMVLRNPNEALEALRLSEELWQEDSAIWASKRAIMAYLYTILGRHADAHRLVDGIQARADEIEIGDATWATAHLATGNHDLALEWLERSLENDFYDEGYDAQTDIAWNLYRDSALESPRFQDVRRRIRLQMSGFE